MIGEHIKPSVCFCPSPLSQTYHILLSSITVLISSSHLNEGIKPLAKTKGKNLDLLVEAKEGFEFTNTENDREPAGDSPMDESQTQKVSLRLLRH